MTLTVTQDDLAYALAERRVDAELTAQTLRDCLQIGMGIGRALEVQAVTLTTERTLTGQLPRGGDLSASFDRFARAMRRTVTLLHKTGDDIVALYRAALADVPEQPEPEPSKPGSSFASAAAARGRPPPRHPPRNRVLPRITRAHGFRNRPRRGRRRRGR
jgi:hypothetical protein